MGALTRDRPKPLLEIGGRSILDRVLDLVAVNGIPRAVINLHYHGDLIRHHLANRHDIEIAFSDEGPEILETGGGLRAALPMLGSVPVPGSGPVLTLNADAFWPDADPVAPLLSAWRSDMEALLHLVDTREAVAHPGTGDFFRDGDGRLSRRGDADKAPYVYTGAQLLQTDRLAAQPAGAFSLNRVWDAMLADGGLYGLVGKGRWVDVGTPAGLAEANALAGAMR